MGNEFLTLGLYSQTLFVKIIFFNVPFFNVETKFMSFYILDMVLWEL